MGKVIGYSKFMSKKGTDCCVVRVLFPATDRDNQFGTFGEVVQEIFVPDAQHAEVTEKVIGKSCTVNYNYYNGRGYVDSIIFS